MRHLVPLRRRRSAGTALLVVLVLNPAPPALFAQSSVALTSSFDPVPSRASLFEGPATRAAVSEEAKRAAIGRTPPDESPAGASSAGRGASLVTDIVLGVGGAIVGFVAGGFSGDALDRYAFGGNHCGCDDPGLRGALWGAFIGAIALPVALLHWLG